jgi:hypothetical protein
MRLDDIATAMGLSMKAVMGPVHARLEVTTDMLAALTHELVTMRERMAALESRPPVPGPAGADGAPGRDGAPGPPGTPGQPGMQFVGAYDASKSYDVGDVVNHDGSGWHCNRTTQRRPGDGSGDWTLFVKRGRDGKGSH